ncbi:MAG: tetratricopeptide repeat protein [Betaproteobacteria bacterium]|nr:tetratricopeptide repeat protein [Betaproteobacteria bacterium]
MTAYDLEEQERIDALKDWWDKWGNWVYAGVGAFVIGALSIQGWRYYEARQNADAEVLFRSVEKTAQEVAASKESKKLSEAATAMADAYPRTFQATDAKLLAAKAAFDAGDLASAKAHLQWVVDNGRDTFKPIARIRLAAVLLDDKKHDEALKSLEQVKDEGYASMVADLRGDVLAAQGKKDEARAAYQIAVEKATDRSPLKAISQAKLDAFGGSPPKQVDAKVDAKDNKGTKQ